MSLPSNLGNRSYDGLSCSTMHFVLAGLVRRLLPNYSFKGNKNRTDSRPLNSGVRPQMRNLILSIFFLFVTSCASRAPHPSGFESSKSLEHDFWLVTLEQRVSGGFEAIGHFQHCFYRQRDLGQCNTLSPSPSGELAVYQAATSGNLFLFRTKDGAATPLTTEFPGLMASAEWNEQDSRVTVLVGEFGKENPVSFSYGRSSRP